MKKNYILNPWKIIENYFPQENNLISESIFSLGNGFMGQRANFEEAFSGNTLQGNYISGVYYPDKTKVGWWKNGYPDYFAKVLNSINWIGINITIDGEILDLNLCTINYFSRELNMKEGYLKRCFQVTLPSGKEIRASVIRFLSMDIPELGAIKYDITALNFNGIIEFTPYLDGDIHNEDSNYNEKFWLPIESTHSTNKTSLTVETLNHSFTVCCSMYYEIYLNNTRLNKSEEDISREKYVGKKIFLHLNMDDTVTLYKYAAIVTSRNTPKDKLLESSLNILNKAELLGFSSLLISQKKAWKEKWDTCDVVIHGDVAAQQGIRFNIFQLNQTYTGTDSEVNIGPKGFTGEKYGGSTYWDTEAYCLPFYLATTKETVSLNLLIYRYKHLEKAKENAKKLGFKKGALYPMVTMNGEECHNEWEITFEEIHRNGAIAYAIYDYVNYTGDFSYLESFGFEVLVEISRFWEERVNFSEEKCKYVILGVTGPNEYENNVNNNWYTNRIACFTLEYTLKVKDYIMNHNAQTFHNLINTLNLMDTETDKWKDILGNMYYPENKDYGIFLQQDGYMDKEQVLVKNLDPNNLPLNQNWSWDRILRSCFIKQADVLQGLYFLEDYYSLDTIKRNFDFYEPRTVHESSLSPCIHSILASKLGYKEKAYEMYLKASRLDLDDYNKDTCDGCHITSMAGSWMAIVKGFGGMRVREGNLHFNPYLPEGFKSYNFKILFRNSLLNIKVQKTKVIITKLKGPSLNIFVFEKQYYITKSLELNLYEVIK